MFFQVIDLGATFEAAVSLSKGDGQPTITLGTYNTSAEAEAELERWSTGVPFLTLRKRFEAMGA